MPQLYMIIPVGLDGNRPDNTLPQPPLGMWGPGFPYPDQGLPGGQGGRPSHPIYHPGHPDHGLPAYPDQGLPGNQPYPDQGLPGGGGGTPVPEDVYTPAPIPEEIASQYVVSAYNPKTMKWTTKSYPPR